VSAMALASQQRTELSIADGAVRSAEIADVAAPVVHDRAYPPRAQQSIDDRARQTRAVGDPTGGHASRGGRPLIGRIRRRIDVDDHGGTLVAPQRTWRPPQVVDRSDSDLGHANERLGVRDPLGAGDLIDGALHQGTVLGLQAGVETPLALARPAVPYVDLGERRAGFVALGTREIALTCE
jgi:hypothetical protein